MGLNDRDNVRNKGKDEFHHYDLKEFLGGEAPPDHPKKPSGGGWVGSLVFFIIVGLFIFYAFQQQIENKVLELKQSNLPNLLSACEPLPPNSSSILIDPSVVKRSDVLYSGVQFDNLLANPVVLLISNQEMTVRYEAVTVYPRQTANISLPIAEYGLNILTGTTWCNINTGFTNGVKIKVNGALPLQSGNTTTVSLFSTGIRPSDILANYSLAPVAPPPAPPSQVAGNGYVDLRRGQNGNYMMSGTVNGAQVEFTLDTGASITSITGQTAQQAGITSCTPRLFNTANGQVNGCVASVPELTFGNFRILNPEVAIMQNLASSALLGMNVLSQVRLEQQGEVMRVSSP